MKLLKDIVLPKLVDVLLLPDIDRQRQLMQHRTNPPIKAHNIIHIHKNPAIDRKKPPIPGQGINRIRKGQPRPITLALFIRHDRIMPVTLKAKKLREGKRVLMAFRNKMKHLLCGDSPCEKLIHEPENLLPKRRRIAILHQILKGMHIKGLRHVQMVVLTLKGNENEDLARGKVMQAEQMLSEVVEKTLRRGDVAASYGANQFLIMLMDTDTERGKIALRRIQKNWEEVNQDYTLDYEIQSMRDLPSEVTSAS